MAAVRVLLPALAATMAGACIALASCVYDDLVARVRADAAIDDGRDTPPADAGLVCPQVDGAAYMVQLDGFCIDATEVTRGQYKAWLDTRPDPRNQDFRCDWNQAAGFPPKKGEPGDQCDDPAGAARDLTTAPDLPVVCVNWCDAFAYCKAHGKRLCGAIQGGSDAPPFETAAAALNDETSSEWYAACAGKPPLRYPYGGDSAPEVCNGSELKAGGAVAAGSLGKCHGKSGTAYGAIYDLSGNVGEWTDSCTAGSAWDLTTCLARGGCFLFVSSENGCRFAAAGPGSNGSIMRTRKHVDNHIGFRCCAP